MLFQLFIITGLPLPQKGLPYRNLQMRKIFSAYSVIKTEPLQLKEMAEKLKVLEVQIAYDAEEIELKDQLAWARVHISEKESAEMARKIATRIEVLILLLQNFL